LVVELKATNNTVISGYAWGLDLSGTAQGAGGAGGLLASKTDLGATGFAASDGNGNVVVLTSADDGTEAARYEYDPFGEVIRATGPVAKGTRSDPAPATREYKAHPDLDRRHGELQSGGFRRIDRPSA